MTEKDLEKAKFYLEEAHRFFDFIHDTRRRIDEKIHNMIVLSGVLVNIVFGLTYFLVEQRVIKTSCVLWLLVLSATSYFGVAVIGLVLYQPQDVGVRNIKKVIEKYEKGEKEAELISPIQHVAWNLSCDAEQNSRTVIKKAHWFRVMLIVFTVGLVFLVVALVSLAHSL